MALPASITTGSQALDTAQRSLASLARAAGILAQPATEAPRPATPAKPVSQVGPQERADVALRLYLSQLACRTDDTELPLLLSEQGLCLVTSSALCEGQQMSPLASTDDSAEGDGMAMPLSAVRFLHSEQAQQQPQEKQQQAPRQGQAQQAGWQGQSRSYGPGGGSVLPRLNAQNDRNSLGPAAAPGRDGTLLQSMQHRFSKAASAAAASAAPLASATAARISSAATSLREPVSQAAKSTMAAAKSTMAAASGQAAAAGGGSSNASSFPLFADHQSRWLVADDTEAQQPVRYFAIDSTGQLPGRFQSDLTTFESYSLGAKINKLLYAEASALYARFFPLVMEHLEEHPGGKVCLTGAGLGGSLATLLLLMFVHRGLRRGAVQPVYVFDAPAVLCEMPDHAAWCSKDGCSAAAMEEMATDLLERGVLAESGLPQDAVKNVQLPASMSGSSAGGAVPAASHEGLQELFSRLLQSARLEAAHVTHFPVGGGGGPGAEKLQFFNPIGQVLVYSE